MPLQNLVGLRQSDPAAILLGREVKLEYLIVHLFRNSGTLIVNLGYNYTIFAPRRNRKRSSQRHGLNPVEHNIEDGLLHHIYVNLDRQWLHWQVAIDGDAMLFGVGGGQLCYLFQQVTKISFLQMEVARASEVD